jgi:hypothetical protein
MDMAINKTLTGTAGVLGFISRRSRYFAQKGVLPIHHRGLAGAVTRQGAVALAYTDPEAPVPTVDEAHACATFVITTPRRDRHGDIVVPTGCVPHLANYERNPRVFFSHQSHCLPVASARDPQTGALALWVSENEVRSTAYFHCQTRESEEVFALIACGELQCCSVGFVPHAAEIFGPETEGSDDGEYVVFDQGGCKFIDWDLLEWSIVPVPANPDAIALRLAKGIGNRPLTESVRQLLEPYAPPPKAWTTGSAPCLTPEALKNAYLAQRQAKKKKLPEPTITHVPSSEAVAAVTAALADAVIAKLTPPEVLDELAAAEPLRWNKALSKAFDVRQQKLRPASLEIDWAAKHLGVKVKEIYETAVGVPSAKLGSFLSAWRDVTANYDLIDARNIRSDGREAPLAYEKIQLNAAHQSDDFLIEGLCFYASKEGAETKWVVALQPTYFGLRLRFYVACDHKNFIHGLIQQAWTVAAAQYNFLKGEAFALSGEFLPKTTDSFAGLFLEAKNEACLKSTLQQFNRQGEDFVNRGTIFFGPPGTGKTLSARVLRNEAQGTFIWISARDCHYAGAFGGIAYAFELARELAPCVLVFEDIDNWLSPHVLDLLKTEMDGLSRSQGLWIILTTNFPEELPEALLDRPGRFHDVLHFALPSASVRAQMFTAWLPGLDTEALAQAVEATEGYSGAHVYELCHFTKTLKEQAEHKSLDSALTEALAKLAEQRALIASFTPHRRKSFALPELPDDEGPYPYRAVLAGVRKGVIPYTKHPKADENAPWNGPAEKAQASIDDLKKMCAWYAGDGTNKSDYKLPHHTAKGYRTVWRGVRAAMGALLGARGGTKIPASDRRGVFNHLAKHYQEFGKEPPEFGKSYTEEELKTLFPDNYNTMSDTVITHDAPPLDDLVPPPADGAKKPKKDADAAVPDVTLSDLHRSLQDLHDKLDNLHQKLDTLKDEDEEAEARRREEDAEADDDADADAEADDDADADAEVDDDADADAEVDDDADADYDADADADADADDADEDDDESQQPMPGNRKPVVKKVAPPKKRGLSAAEQAALTEALAQLKKLARSQKKLNDQFFGLTGRKI